MTAKRKDGKEYEPGSLTSFQNTLQRVLVDRGSKINTKADAEFEKSLKVLASKGKELTSNGYGIHPNAAKVLEQEEIDEMYQKDTVKMFLSHRISCCFTKSTLVDHFVAFWLPGTRWSQENEVGRYKTCEGSWRSGNACVEHRTRNKNRKWWESPSWSAKVSTFGCCDWTDRCPVKLYE